MFGLELSHTLLLFFCLFIACGFEFVNGFHDTANAVATVIYTNSLKPWVAVVWSGIMNAFGVFLGGVGVAMAIVNLLPVETLIDQNIAHSISMVAALLLSAIFWNLITWYFGIPVSSSHTMIGSILGVGIAYSLLPETTSTAVNWAKAEEIGLSLLISPVFGFALVIILMFLLRVFTKNHPSGNEIFKEPKKNSPPPPWIRGILLITCTSVSFFHGSNDGQKGVGLVMLILIGIVPSYFALNSEVMTQDLMAPLKKTELVISSIDPTPLSETDRMQLSETIIMNRRLQAALSPHTVIDEIPREGRFNVRKDLILMDSYIRNLISKDEVRLSAIEKKTLSDNLQSLKSATDYSPFWVITMISISLGLGTMIGWKRIVKTIGEKIGKQHLTYAQGASSELVAASVIGISTALKWPVSTTHVLSSGIAGSMVASKGIKNLQPETVRNILLAWLLTLPVVMVLAGSLFLLFRSISG